MKVRITQWGIAFLTILLLSDAFGGNTIPPRTSTLNTMFRTRWRLADYYRAHHRLPPALADLPLEENKDNSTKDGWGRELGYSFCRDEMVMIWSLGRDGIVGGKDEDADIVEGFQFFDGMHGRLAHGLTLVLNQDGKTIRLILEDGHDEIKVLTEEEVAAMLRRALAGDRQHSGLQHSGKE